MLRLPLTPVRRKSSRPLHEIYRATFDSYSEPGSTGDGELRSFLAATTAKAAAPRKAEAFADTEWLCTQWPDGQETGYDPAVM